MPTFISDPPQTVYLVLIGAAVVTGVIAARRQDRKSFVPFGIALGVLLLVYLFDRVGESPREEATRKVQAMAEAATDADPDRFLEHVSASFNMYGADRERLRKSGAWEVIRSTHARVAVWGFGQDAFERLGDTEVEVGFYAKAQTPDGRFVTRYIKARFVKDPDGQYRVKTMKFYNPAENGLNSEDPIPGFP
jgi:hypothetical protein